MSAARVLMTGASGFVGGHLSRYLADRGYEVHATTRHRADEGKPRHHFCELTDAAGLSELFAKLKPDYLIHLASRAFPSRNLDDFELQVQNTVLPALTLARVAPTSLKLAMFMGSCEEYGNGAPPFREDQPLVSISPYGWAKISAYTGCRMVALQRGLRFCWVRPFLTIGPGQNPNQLVPWLIRGCSEGGRVELSPGEQTRDFIFHEDLCAMIEKILESPDKAVNEAINLCSGKPRSVREMAELIRDIVGRGELAFGALPYRVNEAMSFYGSTEKFDRLFGAHRHTPLREALERTISLKDRRPG